jgi:hypothetical protein
VAVPKVSERLAGLVREVEGVAPWAGSDEPDWPASTVLTIGARRREPRARHHYSWLQDYLVRLEGKEARDERYAWLEE